MQGRTITHFCKVPQSYRRFSVERFSGECLEKVGIPSNGFAVFDRGCDIAPGDIVKCLKPNENIQAFMKLVLQVDDGAVTVGTCYKDPSKDFSFVAGEIIGVVACIINDEGHVVWTPEREKQNVN